MIRWYLSSGGVWDVAPLEHKWYVVRDASGTDHVASIYLADEDGIYVPALYGSSEDGTDKSRLVMLEFSNEDGHRLSSFYYMNTDAGPVRIEPKDLTREITVMPILYIRPMLGDDYYAPISKVPFTISADNASSIALEYLDIDDIGEIGDTDGDGEVLDSTITITDIYGDQNVVSDRIHIKYASVRPAVYTGKELVPEVVYLGKTLKEGVDYVWQKETRWNGETYTVERPEFIEPGDYKIILHGKGRFRGTKYEVIFRIVPAEEEPAKPTPAQPAPAEPAPVKPAPAPRDVKELLDTKLPKPDIKKPVSGKKSLTVKWKKLSAKKRKKIEGIEIQYARNKAFTSKGKIVKAGKTAASKRIKKLAKNKTYYVRVRTYKYAGKVKHFSNWSKVKKVRTK